MYTCVCTIHARMTNNAKKELRNQMQNKTTGVGKDRTYRILTTYVMYLMPKFFREKSFFCGSVTLSPAALTSKSTRLVGVLFTEDLGTDSCCKRDYIIMEYIFSTSTTFRCVWLYLASWGLKPSVHMHSEG